MPLQNFRGVTATSDGVWARELSKSPIPSRLKFGTKSVYSDDYVSSGAANCSLGLPDHRIHRTRHRTYYSVTLKNPQDNGTNFQFQFVSQAGFSHTILYRTNLVLGSWQTSSNVTGDGTLKTVNLPLSVFSPAKQGYVRVTTQ